MKQEDVNSSGMCCVEDQVTRNFVLKMYDYLFGIIAPSNYLTSLSLHPSPLGGPYLGTPCISAFSSWTEYLMEGWTLLGTYALS